MCICEADLIPVLAVWGSLSDLAVQAVGVRGYEDLGHQRGETSSVESLGGGDSHGTHCAPMEGPLHPPGRLVAVCVCFFGRAENSLHKSIEQEQR